jgi:Ca2+/Na+ antiporter
MSAETGQADRAGASEQPQDILSLREELRFWHGTDERHLSEQNRSVIALSSGGIGVSVVFVANRSVACHFLDITVLCLSWVALVAAMLFVFLSFKSARKTAAERARLAEREAKGFDTAEYQKVVEETAARTGRWTLFAQGSFVLGVILTIVFVVIEITGGDHAALR